MSLYLSCILTSSLPQDFIFFFNMGKCHRSLDDDGLMGEDRLYLIGRRAE